MNPIGAFVFIWKYIIDIYVIIVLARFILQVVRADFYNPTSQFIVKATTPILKPLRRIIPGIGGIDVAAIVLMVALVIIKWGVLKTIKGSPLDILDFSFVILQSMAIIVLNFYMFCIFINIIMSWIAQGNYNPFADLVRQIIEPVMAPARRLLPAMGGMDFSPILVLLLISTIKILFSLDSQYLELLL